MIEEHKKAFDIQTRQEIFTQLSKSDMDMANDKLYKNKYCINLFQYLANGTSKAYLYTTNGSIHRQVEMVLTKVPTKTPKIPHCFESHIEIPRLMTHSKMGLYLSNQNKPNDSRKVWSGCRIP